MGKIVKKKKGRPSKADLSCHAGSHRDPPESEIRRSTRRRNLTYIDDFYDDDEEDERGRSKKLKLVLKLDNNNNNNNKNNKNNKNNVVGFDGADSASQRGGGRRREERVVGHGSATESGAAVDGSSECGDDEVDVRWIGSRDQKKTSGQNQDSNRIVSVPGSPIDCPSRVPLPDRKQLELILDKLQKKDTYGVFADPVDPEELPDYHDVIEHPMDFGTIRKKMAKGAYSDLEQFENDVFLVCTNAMQYNAPETIYFKQARSIQELARMKFQKLRIDFEHNECDRELKAKSNPIVKKPIKKSPCKTAQEPVGSDFSSGANLATMGDTRVWGNMLQAGGYERPSNGDRPLVGSSSLIENKLEKAEVQLSGKGCPPKFGRKPFVQDENRRATYNISNQSMVRTESMFSIFEGENKQLVTVGLHADHSYARSLSRFAATLGPFAWKIVSRRIEQALPVGFKFGRGWVGEYEPLPTPVLILENHTQKQPERNFPSTAESEKADKTTQGLKVGEYGPLSTPVLMCENNTQKQIDPNLQCIADSRNNGKTAEGLKACDKFPDSAKERYFSRPTGEPALFGMAGAKPIVNALYQQQNPLLMNYARSEKNVFNGVESNCSSSTSGKTIDVASQKQLEHGSEMSSSRFLEVASRNRNVEQSVISKHPENGGVVAGGLPNGKAVSSSSDNHKMSTLSYDFMPHGNSEHLSDPVQVMRMLAEKTQNQQKSLNPITADHRQVTSLDPSLRRDDSSAAANAAARAWMTVGAAQFKSMDNSVPPKMQIGNVARDLPQSFSQYRKDAPDNEPHFQHNRPMGFPQLVTTELSRFQMQSSWQGLSPHTQPNKKQDTLPPDLNIRFQSPGSPVRQSSGVIVDCQLPDLALQL